MVSKMSLSFLALLRARDTSPKTSVIYYSTHAHILIAIVIFISRTSYGPGFGSGPGRRTLGNSGKM